MPYNLMPYTNLHELNLDWIIARIKEINDTRTETAGYAAEAKLYKEAAQVQASNALASANSANQAMNNALDSATAALQSVGQAAASATQAQQYAEHIADPVAGLVTQWLQDHILQETGYVIDNTLTVQGAAADAKKVGDILFPTTRLLSYIATLEYSQYQQRNVDTEGRLFTSPSYVGSDYIELDSIVNFKKPVGYGCRYAGYDENYSFVANSFHTISYNLNIDGNTSVLYTNSANIKYVVVCFSHFVEESAVPFTPAELEESGIAVTVETDTTIPALKSMIDSLNQDNEQYFKYSDITLTADMSFNLPMKSERYKNMIISHYAMYEAAEGITDRPYIYVSRDWKNSAGNYANFYNSPRYYIGDKGQYANRQCRIPPFMNESRDYVTVRVIVPAGITLHIKSLFNSYDDMISRGDSGIHLNAHGFSGFGGPAQTLIQFEMAARLGYRYCITIPKVTSDGVYVCLHDDDSIQATARNDDGSQIAAEYRDRPVSTFTYNELLQFDFGIARGLPFKGERIPLLEDFFRICAKSGMHPMLSVHPSLSGHWNNIKALASKYGVLDKLNIKSDGTSLEIPMQALGDVIESYTIDVSTSESKVERFNTLKTRYNISKARCVIEYNNAVITEALITDVLSNGYSCGCYNSGNDFARLNWLMDKGVTEFTEDYNCSVGLNW